MKKLSMLIALILIATIGGVYATWTYTGDNQVYTMSTKGVVMTNIETSTLDVGSYHINSNLSQGIIDQKKGDNPDTYHQAVLSYELQNNETVPAFSVEFIPSLSADANAKNYGITTYLWFGAPEMTYDCNGDGQAEDIFLVTYGTDNYITIHPVGTDLTGLNPYTNYVWQENGDGFIFNFIASDATHTTFEAVFTLNDVILDTESEYTAFKNSITKFIRGVVSNKVPAETTLGDQVAENP